MTVPIRQTLSNGELRELAGALAEDLARRGLTLGDVERLAPLLVDRFRLMPARTGDVAEGPRAAGMQGRGR